MQVNTRTEMTVRRVKKLDNPLPKVISIQSLQQYTELQDSFMKRYNMRYSAFRELLNVVTYYVNEGVAISKYGLHKRSMGLECRAYQGLFERINKLVAKGLLEVYKGSNCDLYIPSDKALKELSELVK